MGTLTVRCLIIQNRLGLEGRTRCVVEFVRALNELGEEPEIVCLSVADRDIGRAFGLSGLRYRLSPLAPWARIRSAYKPEVLLTNFLAARTVDRLRPELVFNSNDTWAFLPSGPRYIHYIHAPFKSLRYVPRYERGLWSVYASVLTRVHESAPPPRSHLVVNSIFTRTRLSEAYSLDAAVIYPPAWNGQLLPPRADLRRVVTLGSFHPDKRQLDQIEIARRLPEWHFTLLGSPAASGYARRVQLRASELHNVEVVLNPSRQRVDAEFARASHFVHTHPHEGFGIAAVEAAAAGCVPIVPDGGGMREIVEPASLRFSTIQGCVDALRASTGATGRQVFGEVQRRLGRFGSNAFRTAMADLVAPSDTERLTAAAVAAVT